MNTKNIFKTVALAMLMPAMLLTTACSNEDDIANTSNITSKGYALPVTVNVTRQNGATRATFDGSKLNFSAGDKLFVEGSHAKADRFAGTLDYFPATGKFSGTIYTESLYEGTIDDLLNGNYATLLPAGYGSYDYLEIMDDGYGAHLGENAYNSFATSKKLGVEQLSFEHGEYTSGTGFVLEPRNAILNFTITGLAASTNVTATLSDDEDWTPDIEGEVTTDGSGNATFAIGLEGSSDLNEFSLTVAGNAITLVNSSKTLDAGKIYNITRNAIPGALVGKFSVSSTKKVYFSKGNLQATTTDLGANWTWAFAEHQWDYIGNAAGNTMVTATSPFINGNATVDLFGWVGASSNWDGVNKYGITSSDATNNKNGYGNVASESLKSDWGTLIGSGWRTLSMAEWSYLLATRTVNGGKGADKSYTLNQSVNGKKGMVIYPDNYTGAVYSGDNWASFEAAGCVFLPAAGWRDGTTIKNSINDRGYYWSTTPSNATAAKRMFFAAGLELDGDNSRAFGFSVRLVYNAN